jgi:hypothetical protein
VLPPRIFPDQDDLAKIRPGYEAALRAELANIIERIPAKELAIHGTARPKSRTPMAVFQAIRWKAQSSATCPKCETSRRKSRPMSRSAIISASARSAAGHASGRMISAKRSSSPMASSRPRAARWDWIHLPVLDRSDDAFFAPLKDIEPRGARVYLGLIHNMAGFKARLQTARKYLADFGLGGYCGFGRLPAAQLPIILREHIEAVTIASFTE